jgi:OmpA-OmpF porin, OOP family
MNYRNALVAATMLALPLAANAQPITGIYVGAGAGVNIMLDQKASTTLGNVGLAGIGPGTHLSTRLGPAASVSLGYGLGNGLRTEIEGSYRYNTFSSPSSSRAGLTTAGGQEEKFGAMFNVLYDFVGLTPYVQPYVGAGIGYQWAKDDNLYVATPPIGNVPGRLVRAQNSTEGSFAYQGIVGAAMPITSVPGLALTADYRFMAMPQTRSFPATATVGATTVAARAHLSDNYNNTIMVGVRYNFGVAPPPSPAPAPAAVAPSPISRSYLVFFDWDKATLTDRARQIVSEAAANSTKVQFTQIEVNGYTDTSGSAKYNQGLSVRRAQAVAVELVKDGVPKNAIAIQGFGQTHLLVPTGDGVREPQNRRVEIIIK